jgi:MFS family permease
MARTAGWGLGRARVPADVAALCLVIFLADILAGIVVPTFPLHAQRLGIGLGALGALGALSGIVQLVVAIPFGILSDRIGRPIMIVGGMACFGLGLLCFALARGVPLLIIGRILFGLAPVATFQIGTAQLGDITTPGQRSFAFGLYATAMGLGFTIGPLIGGQLAERAGVPAAYLVGVALALLGVGLALRTVRPVGPGRGRATGPRGLRALAAILGRADIALVCLGNLLVTWTFAGAITTFFPLYGATLGLTAATLGSFFALRAFVSALDRLPNALVVRAFGNRAVLFAALAIEAAIMFAMAHVTAPALLALLLAGEGLTYGAYLVAGQAYIADQATAENRGTATGLYGMAASLGGVAAPAAMGILAARAGLPAVFTGTAWLLVVGLLASVLVGARTGRAARARA